MTLEAGIHRHWSGYKPLTDLVPADSVRTLWFAAATEGQQSEMLPYVVVTRDGEPSTERHSGGKQMTEVSVVFAVISNDYDLAKEVERVIATRFDNTDFTFSGGRCLNMMRSDRSEERGEDGTYVIAISYDTLIEE